MTTVDAKQQPVGPDELAGWFRGRQRLVVARGTKWSEHRLEDLDRDALAALVLGPSGKLRAPTLLVGDAVVVGFHAEAYARVLG